MAVDAERRYRVSANNKLKISIMTKFYCEYCGQSYSTVRLLAESICPKNPNGGRNHKLYEGSEKSKYTCKYCGHQYSTLRLMAQSICPKNPEGKKNHSPAL